jgi:hypothetical protein
MEAIKLRAHVGADGILKVELPRELANKQAEFVIIYTIEESQTEDWADFVNRMYGCLADDPIERPEQLPLEVRDEIE